MNSRKYPRTMAEAFGPYTSNEISEDDEPVDRLTTWGSAIALIVFLACSVMG